MRRGRMRAVVCGCLLALLFPMGIGAAEAEPAADIVLYVDSNKALVGDQEWAIDENNPNVITKLVENRAMLPLRFIAETIGAEVSWKGETEEAVVKLNQTQVVVAVGSKQIIKNGQVLQLDVPAFEENGRTYVPVRAVSESLGKQVRYERGLVLIGDTTEQLDQISQETCDSYIGKLSGMQVVGTKENWEKLKEEKYQPIRIGGGSGGSASGGTAANGGNVPPPGTGENQYSDTNVQTDGISEADTVKTDGNYIYRLRSNSIVVVRAVPTTEMQVTSVIQEEGVAYTQMYLYNDQLIVVGTDQGQSNTRFALGQRVHVLIYQVTDPQKPVQKRHLQIDGVLNSSRMDGNYLYLVTNTGYSTKLEDFRLPSILDGKQEIAPDYKSVYYFDEQKWNAFMMVTGLDISEQAAEIESTTFLTDSSQVYMSSGHLYVLQTGYETVWSGDAGGAAAYTNIVKFAVAMGKIQFLNVAKIEGKPLNQFSMDEYQGYFRIALSKSRTMNNRVIVFNQAMEAVSMIENIAPGEQIYAVRFTGNTGYVVTYRNTDPLFVLDMNPQDPKILGELKIPGFSNYLHPYHDQYVIGFGKETSLGLHEDGFKLSLFDVSDPTNPIELHQKIIKGFVADSPVLQDHKALMVMPDLNLIGLPLYAITEPELKGERSEFNGGCVFEVTPENGFQLKGSISHIGQQPGTYQNGNKIDRLVYIDGNIYALSQDHISVNPLSDFSSPKFMQLSK